MPGIRAQNLSDRDILIPTTVGELEIAFVWKMLCSQAPIGLPQEAMVQTNLCRWNPLTGFF
jgi:hypothetical protein